MYRFRRNAPERLSGALRRVGYDPRILTSYAQQGEHNRGAWTHELPRVRRWFR